MMTTIRENPPIPKSESWKIFDAIYKQYDFVNNVLSFGLHKGWRQRIVKLAPRSENLKILDLATGTADVLIALASQNSKIQNGYGIDLSEKMLQVGREKIARKHLENRLTLQKGDATQLNFLNDEFDLTTMSFGIRNVENPILVLKEMYRVLKKQGRTIILEFSLPANLILKVFYLLYLKVIVPLIGGLLSGNFKAYFYLNRTIEKFPYGEMFCRMMRQCGFQNVTATPLFFGVATIYCGEKV